MQAIAHLKQPHLATSSKVLFWQADLSKPPDAQSGLPQENDSWIKVLIDQSY
jgi:hypothetical protein